MSDVRPIGIFDSGLGGLTVTKEIIKLLPHENLVYLGDTARVPYGTRSKETVQKFSKEDADFLKSKDVKIIVIACNTASALAGNYLKETFELPVFEVITEAAIEAGKNTKNKKVGVIGTKGTIGSGAYQNIIKENYPQIEIFSQPCPLLVPFIEEGELDSEALRIVTTKYLKDIKNNNVDTLILGCTHYPIIKKTIEEIVGDSVKLIDPGKSISKVIYEYLDNNDMLNTDTETGKKEFYVTDLNDNFKVVAEMFLGGKIPGSLKKTVLNEKEIR